MTPQHRHRLWFAAVLAFIVLMSGTAPIFARDGFAAGLGMLAVSAVLPALVIGIVGYIWTGNDREAARTGIPRQHL
ncbi:predicted Na+-dependent transporter [Microbacterium testaceum StLB037]|uniref:Predicted Na+-dependent transporter n=1 Tax=Microbacterium testaceum (strain StLB037) TaxID=979556 RepID=E8ND51_MICTS|nr:hypothetical protein [Microbacterium testaceum]BAJ73690.1 predicted Na+-dependent transporter [Microbacterium testaceum StLB037]